MIFLIKGKISLPGYENKCEMQVQCGFSMHFCRENDITNDKPKKKRD